MSLSRKERRAAAKNMGLLSQSFSYQKFAERLNRSNKAGEMMHKKHLEDQRWELKKKDESKAHEAALREIQSRDPDQPFNFDPSSFGFLNPESSDEDLPQ
jgi:hypothetical protein